LRRFLKEKCGREQINMIFVIKRSGNFYFQYIGFEELLGNQSGYNVYE